MIASEERKTLIVGVSSTGDTMLVRAAEAVYADLPDIVEADQLRFIASANTTDLRPGASYAGFRFGTAHDVLLALGARRS